MGTMIFRDFQDLWRQMSQKNDGYLALAIDHPLDLRMGYDIRGIKSLVVMNSGSVRNLPPSQSISTENPFSADGTRRLEFKLLDPNLEDTYLRLCWDIIDYSNGPDALKRMLRRYLTWQKLLQAGSGQMSFERQKGLLGELLYLEELMELNGANVAVYSWSGPDGGDQDFIFEHSWTEVKSVALAASEVHISSLEQFRQEQNGTLRVYFLEKTIEGNNRINLVQQVDKIKHLLETSPHLEDQFEMKLFKYGYQDKHRERYKEICFQLHDCYDYEVSADFPRLTRENVPVAVTECKYKLSLAAIEPFRRK